ncbi:hypothetical protein BCY91_06625 [Pelobium manganitolerans]|uniref:DUF983 domain-containing protein n=2 Tax=Pelobium manganitolerans TaxID=1842495 RepID=A0A419S5F9_9SPHI|nr:hypothetical protein BCY91_06625 [Pelobium manganitolerans]
MTKISAGINEKCPRCRKGDIYKNSIFSWKYAAMHERCPYCNQKYEIEPGFFYAAMYVSYAFTVAELVIAGIAAFYTVGESNLWLLMAITISPVILLMTINFRYSRTILLHYLSPIKYQKDL